MSKGLFLLTGLVINFSLMKVLIVNKYKRVYSVRMISCNAISIFNTSFFYQKCQKINSTHTQNHCIISLSLGTVHEVWKRITADYYVLETESKYTIYV